MRIMYVEDNVMNLSLVKRVARMGGHEVISFSNGSEALKALENDPCHLILMDIELEGELDGTEVVKRLRARGDKRPIVAVTAYAMVGDKERILASGCDDYLPKPVPIARLLELIAQYDPANVTPAAGAKVKDTAQTDKEPQIVKRSLIVKGPAVVGDNKKSDKTTETGTKTGTAKAESITDETVESRGAIKLKDDEVAEVKTKTETPATKSTENQETESKEAVSIEQAKEPKPVETSQEKTTTDTEKKDIQEPQKKTAPMNSVTSKPTPSKEQSAEVEHPVVKKKDE